MSVIRGSEWNKWDLHLHTASSYDYKYKGNDADDLLCASLVENGIKAVAITDHFLIDQQRIESLRSKAPGIVFFPGVELRTDKGSNNLHVILIFSEASDLRSLSGDFDAIMKRGKAKSSDSNETIYWSFDDILDFAKQHDALISIHAGRKTNGLDKEISNALPVKEAIKTDIAEHIHFFEIGQKRDIDDYSQHVFKVIERKPLIMCSDNHDPQNYSQKETLWIKGELTFAGLKQCIYQPLERVFIGAIPPVLDRLKKNKQANIDSISIKRVPTPTNDTMHWFDAEIPLNPSMVAIIGNKGTGKSALSDIIGHLCKCENMGSASFLSEKRFRKHPKNYSADYVATIQWADGEKYSSSLDEEEYPTTIEDAQYLPQKFIEDVCTDIDNGFQGEIDKVIFSYVEKAERGEARNLEELVQQKSKPLEIKMQADKDKLHNLNMRIVDLESKKTTAYKKRISDSLAKAQETLERHEKSRPEEIRKPEPQEDDSAYVEKLNEVNTRIQELNDSISEATNKIVTLNALVDEANTVVAKIELLENQFEDVREVTETYLTKHGIDVDLDFNLTTPKEIVLETRERALKDKEEIQNKVNDAKSGYAILLQRAEEEKERLISTANIKEKEYQKYLKDLDEWEKRRASIIGNAETEGTLTFFQCEQKYIAEKLNEEYNVAISERDNTVKNIHADKAALISAYEAIYAPIQGEIRTLLGDIEDNVEFQAELYMRDHALVQKTLEYIDQRKKGKFGRSREKAYQDIDRRIRSTDFNDSDSVLDFVHFLSEAATEDLENAADKISDIQGFYDFIYDLDYIGVNFKLKMGNRNLSELSPGERGIVLLIFYLALSKESKPIIIDQPEDNLDNQSVYSKLVPCICKAKQRRQVIIVTHNPNIAVACDAEQIIFCEMDKNACQIRYSSGAIENQEIRKHVVDVLEGTKPAFDLRRLKYN